MWEGVSLFPRGAYLHGEVVGVFGDLDGASSIYVDGNRANPWFHRCSDASERACMTAAPLPRRATEWDVSEGLVEALYVRLVVSQSVI